MGTAKDFFKKRIFINGLVFSLPVSVLLTWRFIYTSGLAFFSLEAVQIYLFFAVASFLLFLFVFFILAWLSKRPQE